MKNKSVLLILSCFTLYACGGGGSGNQAPTASSKSVTLDEDTSITDTVAGNDPEGQSISFSMTRNVQNGTLTFSNGSFEYIPNENYNGVDSFQFTVSDGSKTSAPATVTLNVSPVNDAPTANSSSYSTDEDVPAEASIIATDIDGDDLTVTIVSDVANGTLVFTGVDFIYTPNANYFGADMATMTVSDGDISTQEITVDFTIKSINDAPVSEASSGKVNEDEELAGSLIANDVDGDNLTFEVEVAPASGSVSISGRTYTYTPNQDFNGQDNFSFTATDGVSKSNVSSVDIEISPVNDAPISSHQAFDLDEDVTLNSTLGASDVDGDELDIVITQNPASGTLTVVDGLSFTYQPEPNEFGSYQFKFKVTDGQIETEEFTGQLDIASINDLPVLVDIDFGNLEAGVETIWDPSASDNDNEDSLAVKIITEPTIAEIVEIIPTATIPGVDTIKIQAEYGLYGSDSFEYLVNDGTVDSNMETAEFEVVAPQTTPNLTTKEVNLTLDDLALDYLADSNGDYYLLQTTEDTLKKVLVRKFDTDDNELWTTEFTVAASTEMYRSASLGLSESVLPYVIINEPTQRTFYKLNFAHGTEELMKPLTALADQDRMTTFMDPYIGMFTFTKDNKLELVDENGNSVFILDVTLPSEIVNGTFAWNILGVHRPINSSTYYMAGTHQECGEPGCFSSNGGKNFFIEFDASGVQNISFDNLPTSSGDNRPLEGVAFDNDTVYLMSSRPTSTLSKHNITSDLKNNVMWSLNAADVFTQDLGFYEGRIRIGENGDIFWVNSPRGNNASIQVARISPGGEVKWKMERPLEVPDYLWFQGMEIDMFGNVFIHYILREDTDSGRLDQHFVVMVDYSGEFQWQVKSGDSYRISVDTFKDDHTLTVKGMHDVRIFNHKGSNSGSSDTIPTVINLNIQ